MPLILPGNVGSATAATTYSITNSCRWNYADSPAMNKSQTSGNTKTWTYSWWCKRGEIGGSAEKDWFKVYASGSNLFHVRFNTNDDLYCEINNGSAYGFTTNHKFRDPSAWMHFALIMDTTQGTDTNRMKLFVNGKNELTDGGGFSSITYPAENADLAINNSAATFYLGTTHSGTEEFDGYMADVVLLDGTAAAIGDLGENDEDSPTIWKPKDPSGLTFGNNGFHLDFKDSANLGNDANGGTDLGETNLAAVDQATDTPTNNFCTMNPLDDYYPNSTFSEGNCKIVTNSSNYSFNTGTIGLTAGKWYFEAKCATSAGSDKNVIGISAVPSDATTNYLGEDAYMWSYYGQAGNSVTGGTSSSYGDSYTTNDIVGVAIDLDNNKLYFAKNNTWQDSGDPTSGATGTGALSITAVTSTTSGVYFPAMGDYSSDSSTTWEINFGNPVAALTSAANDANGYGNFEYAPPSGYISICTKNLGSDGG